MKLNNSNNGLRKSSLTKSTLNGSQSLMKGKSEPGFQKTKLSSGSSTLQRGHTELKVAAKKGSTRLLGDQEEAQVMHTFEKAGLKLEETANSGATNFDGDMVIHCIEPDYIRAEVKFRNTEGFTVVKDHWKMIKLKSLRHGGIPALITVNKNREQLITMSVEDLASILKKAIGK